MLRQYKNFIRIIFDLSLFSPIKVHHSLYLVGAITGESYEKRITDIKDYKEGLSDDYNLNQNFPNPFNPSTIIQFVLYNRQFLTLKIYDVLVKEVATLINEENKRVNMKLNLILLNII